jgi:adenosylhomocysteine nucleosidase
MNIGASNTGPGSVVVHGNAVGKQINNAPVPQHRSLPETSPGSGPAFDVGILTVLPLEMYAVVEVLQRASGYRTYQIEGGAQVHEARLAATDPGVLNVVAMQTVDRGPRSAALAYRTLRQLFSPPLVLLVGVAGGIRPVISIGDVVISDSVIYYDARRETPEGIRRRGQAQATAPVLRNRLNEFFRRHGDQIPLGGATSIRVHWGPIGSGDAVITDCSSDIRHYLSQFNEKTLAVETEAAGVAQAFYEEVQTDQALRGWLTIRGISDHADAAKGHAQHVTAAHHAAVVMAHLLPLLKLTGAPG